MSLIPHILAGDSKLLLPSWKCLHDIPVDEVRRAPADWQPSPWQTTLAHDAIICGPSTYRRGRLCTLKMSPATDGWNFQRTDLTGQPLIPVAPNSIRSANRSLVLHSGGQANYFRMTEHIIALRYGLGLDNLRLTSDSFDPPLFDNGSLPLVKAVQQAGIEPLPGSPRQFLAVQKPVAIINPKGGFLLLEPPPDGDRRLTFDVAVDFPTAIGRQRIQFDLHPDIFAYGASARTNCSATDWLLLRTLGVFSSEYRHIGYTDRNILVAGKHAYRNQPALLHDGKSLEAVWHRACLDLIAALSLLSQGWLCGKVTSYKAGHALDAQFVNLLTQKRLLTAVK